MCAQDLRESLRRKQLPSGGWAALSWSSQASLEGTALAHLALASNPVQDEARNFLLRMQNPNGSWPAFEADDQEGSWTTSLVLIALRNDLAAILERQKGYEWLMETAGRESQWPWKWKFRTTDLHVRFDPDKFGWPWIPHANSWVVPTAFAILALNQLPCTCVFNDSERRVDLGIQMLLDRVCPGGGWNAGNGVVYGKPMAPHPDDTAIALLALSSLSREPIVSASLDWLERIASEISAPWSLSWSVLALAAYSRPVTVLLDNLSRWRNLAEPDDLGALASTCLAFDYQETLARFGIST